MASNIVLSQFRQMITATICHDFVQAIDNIKNRVLQGIFLTLYFIRLTKHSKDKHRQRHTKTHSRLKMLIIIIIKGTFTYTDFSYESLRNAQIR